MNDTPETPTQKVISALEKLTAENKDLTARLRAVEAEKAELERKVDKVKRLMDIADKANDEKSDMEVALSASFEEAIAHVNCDLLEARIAELQSSLATSAAERDRLDQLYTGSRIINKEMGDALQSICEAVGVSGEAPEIAEAVEQKFSASVARVAELEGDRERLDWLEKHSHLVAESFGLPGFKWWDTKAQRWILEQTLRAALDSAIRAGAATQPTQP